MTFKKNWSEVNYPKPFEWYCKPALGNVYGIVFDGECLIAYSYDMAVAMRQKGEKIGLIPYKVERQEGEYELYAIEDAYRNIQLISNSKSLLEEFLNDATEETEKKFDSHIVGVSLLRCNINIID